MFVASNKDRHRYATPRLRNLFVGIPKRNRKEERYFRYLGIYRVTLVDPLSAEEWKSLPSTVSHSRFMDFIEIDPAFVGQTKLRPRYPWEGQRFPHKGRDRNSVWFGRCFRSLCETRMCRLR